MPAAGTEQAATLLDADVLRMLTRMARVRPAAGMLRVGDVRLATTQR